MKTKVIILAAGQGTRMKSRLPKVLHRLAGRPLLAHVVDTARILSPADIRVVVGHGGEQVQASLDGQDIVCAGSTNSLVPVMPCSRRWMVSKPMIAC